MYSGFRFQPREMEGKKGLEDSSEGDLTGFGGCVDTGVMCGWASALTELKLSARR